MSSFTIVFFAVIVLLGGLLSISFNKVVDYIVTFVNGFISAGDISVSYVGYWSFVIGLLRAAPFLIVFAVSMWAIVRANERRTQGM